jgi:hypothetical protein
MSAPTLNSAIQVAQSQSFDLIILRHLNSEILLSHTTCGFALPQITIPTRQRIAQCITESVLNAWNLKTVCLFQPEVRDGIGPGENQYMVLEPRDPVWQPPADLRWVSGDRMQTVIDSMSECRVVRDALQAATAYNNGALRGPFARVGWIDELMSWAQAKISSRKLSLTGRFRQLNASPFFSLIKLETTGPALWFKAVGEPNLHEYSITLGLAQEYPRYLPEIIAAKPEWNGWLMFEVEGERIGKSLELKQWLRVAETLARLQLGYLGKDRRLLEIGCKDRRIAAIIRRIDPFLDCMDRLMQEQPSEPPRRLHRLELQEIGGTLKDAFRCMEQAGIPDSLIHGDFNPENVLINSSNCVFLDWAEGSVGPPFLTLEYLVEFLRRTHVGVHQYESDLRHAYACCWSRVASERQICEAMRIAPSLAVFCYALGSQAWEYPELMHRSGIGRYLRALTRRLQQELRAMKAPGTLPRDSWISSHERISCQQVQC